LLGFALAAASFMGATIYADSLLGHVAERSHDVSDNAMPSIVELGTIRRELAWSQFAVDEATDGDPSHMSQFPEHIREYEAARERYLKMPRFPGEAELWAQASADLHEAERSMDRARASLAVGAEKVANVEVTERLFPTVSRADAALARLVELNRGAGTAAASEADRAWARVRRFSFAADLVCAAMTGLLAWLAFRGTRSFMAMQEVRAQELEAFASRVAHDVRGPMTPALFALQMLDREVVEDKRLHSYTQRGIRSLRRVEQLVGDLLTFARAAAQPEQGAHASLRPVVVGVVQDAEEQAVPAGVRIDVGELPDCEVACAPGVLSSILMNLVSNAIKHMPKDAAERSVRVTGGAVRGRVRVEVADTGAGLPEGMREQVFEPYVRLDRSRPGIGLGLATVRRLVLAHGGKVGVGPNSGTGSVFWFELPVQEQEPPPRGELAQG
jgi:signal transduction histidine kinase